MTWIAACSGERGIHQETVMTDEERKKLITDLKAARPGYPPGELCLKAADEIERLVEDQNQLVEQLTIRSETGMAKDMQTIMQISNTKTDEIERLQERVDQLEAQVTAMSRM